MTTDECDNKNNMQGKEVEAKQALIEGPSQVEIGELTGLQITCRCVDKVGWSKWRYLAQW